MKGGMSVVTSETIKKNAREYGADLVGIGDIRHYEGIAPQHDPKMICPTAKSLIGLAIRIPRGTMKVVEHGRQQYALTALGAKNVSEELFVRLLMRVARLIENEGYEACIQRNYPNIRAQDDYGTNPEVESCVRLGETIAVGPGKPAPEVIIDFTQAAVICGMGSPGYRGNLLTPEFGPFQRLGFIITNAPLEPDPVLAENLCDGCGECAKACPGKAILDTTKRLKIAGRDYQCGTYDEWQCSVYYRGAHRSNPYIKEDFLKDHPEREAILDGTKRFTAESAKEIYPYLDFLPVTHYGYVPCLCKRSCDLACYAHLKAKGLLRKRDLSRYCDVKGEEGIR
jgi:epoxyqueuosine reductase